MIKRIRYPVAVAWSLVKGLVITLKNCLIPAITLQYPTQKQPMSDAFRGLVDLHPGKCIACYLCARICPTACLALSHKQEDKKKLPETFKYNVELCCFCGLCSQVCPTAAIYMNKIYEISVYDRDKLRINLLNPGKYDEWVNPTVK